MSPAGNWSENFKEMSRNLIGIAYILGSAVLEGAAIDLHVGTPGIDKAALEVACPPPEIGANIFTKASRSSFEMAYIASCLTALEGAVMDVNIGIPGTDSAALEVACPAPGSTAKI
jgi:hypothetical protein